MGIRTDRIVLVVLGLLLLGNPWYLDALITRGGGGWGFTFLYSGLFTVLGMLSATSGTLVPVLARNDRFRRLGILVLVVVSVLSVPVFEAILIPFFDVAQTRTFGFVARKLFVAAVAGSCFVIAAAVPRGDFPLAVAGLSFPVLSYGMLLGEWGLTGPLLDLLLLSLGTTLLGIPGMGLLGFMLAGSVGWWVGTANRRRSD